MKFQPVVVDEIVGVFKEVQDVLNKVLHALPWRGSKLQT